LPRHETIFAALADEIAITFEILDGKRSSGDQRPGRILRLAEKSAIFYSETRLAELANLKVILNNNAGGADAQIIYAKVMRTDPDESNCYEMRFTFVPGKIKSYFNDILNTNQK
jgi:hypothetical protein